jgi:hypothetical protein
VKYESGIFVGMALGALALGLVLAGAHMFARVLWGIDVVACALAVAG